MEWRAWQKWRRNARAWQDRTADDVAPEPRIIPADDVVPEPRIIPADDVAPEPRIIPADDVAPEQGVVSMAARALQVEAFLATVKKGHTDVAPVQSTTSARSGLWARLDLPCGEGAWKTLRISNSVSSGVEYVAEVIQALGRPLTVTLSPEEVEEAHVEWQAWRKWCECAEVTPELRILRIEAGIVNALLFFRAVTGKKGRGAADAWHALTDAERDYYRSEFNEYRDSLGPRSIVCIAHFQDHASDSAPSEPIPDSRPRFDKLWCPQCQVLSRAEMHPVLVGQGRCMRCASCIGSSAAEQKTGDV